MRDPDQLTEVFRRQGLKVTPQRRAIFAVLHDDHTHPSAEAVHRAVLSVMPTVSLRTVYQTLNDLAEMGEIRHLEVGTGSARFDPNVEAAHHHAVCEVCGMVRDLPDESVAATPGGLPVGFEVNAAEIVVRGRCADCVTAAGPSTVVRSTA